MTRPSLKSGILLIFSSLSLPSTTSALSRTPFIFFHQLWTFTLPLFLFTSLDHCYSVPFFLLNFFLFEVLSIPFLGHSLHLLLLFPRFTHHSFPFKFSSRSWSSFPILSPAVSLFLTPSLVTWFFLFSFVSSFTHHFCFVLDSIFFPGTRPSLFFQLSPAPLSLSLLELHCLFLVQEHKENWSRD